VYLEGVGIGELTTMCRVEGRDSHASFCL